MAGAGVVMVVGLLVMGGEGSSPRVMSPKRSIASRIRGPAAHIRRLIRERKVENRNGGGLGRRGASALRWKAWASGANGNNIRRVDRIDRPARLPVWPVVNGLAFTMIDLLGQRDLARTLEEKMGGRVAPMMLDYHNTNPFVLVVHHRHSFSPFDPIRPISNLVLPEGFPAHPHRGFETITYVLKGGFIHRDSIGVKMKYWADENGGGPSVQWLTTGRGLLHEEFWDKTKGMLSGPPPPLDFLSDSQQELFQIWLNLPGRAKMMTPRVQLLGPGEVVENINKEKFGEVSKNDIPISNGDFPGVSVRVIAGSHMNVESKVETVTDVTLLHILMQNSDPERPDSIWETSAIPPSHSVFFYVRSGKVLVSGDTEVEAHETCYLQRHRMAGRRITIECLSDSADILFFSGEPIQEPIATGGSMVMNSESEISQAYIDYSSGKFGVPWEHTVSDSEWAKLVSRKNDEEKVDLFQESER